jgi:hypothetical protein
VFSIAAFSLETRVLAESGTSEPTAETPTESPTEARSDRLADSSSEPSSLLRDLDDPDYATRERATRQLLADASINPEALRSLYAASRTAEQRHRLRRAMLHHLTKRIIHERFPNPTAGAIGISMQPAEPDADEGVVVRWLLLGFPGAERLRVGDRIVAYDGVSLRGLGREAVQRLSLATRERASGDTMSLRVVRDGRAQDVSLVLSHYDALRGIVDPTTNTLLPPHDARWRALLTQLDRLHPEPPPLRVPEPLEPNPAPRPDR